MHFRATPVWHMDVPGLGVKSELQLPACATATAAPDPSHVCDLHPSSWQCRFLNPLSEARDRTHILMDTGQTHFHCDPTGTPWQSYDRRCNGQAASELVPAGQHFFLSNKKVQKDPSLLWGHPGPQPLQTPRKAPFPEEGHWVSSRLGSYPALWSLSLPSSLWAGGLCSGGSGGGQ